jgi:hypothetical protein
VPSSPETGPGAPYELDRGTCLALLSSVRVGRVVLHGAGPGAASVMPVNFVVDGEAVVLRTGDGTILEAARAGTMVTFQADSFQDVAGGSGWSVTVAGTAREATGSVLRALDDLPLTPLAGGSRDHVVVIPVESAEGRRVGGPAASR